MSPLTLKILTPEENDRTVACDSISLWMAADEKNRGEGSIGIHKGHSDAVIALGNGPIKAFQNAKPVFSAETEGGFAAVLHDTVTVVTPKIKLS